jgi:hypothetical protein
MKMKKTLAILAVLVMVFAATASLAEEPAKMTFSGGVEFNMDMDQVMGLMKELNLPNPEIDREKTRGPVEFWELEYEDIASYDGFKADMKYSFVGNGLVAIHYDFAKGTSYEEVKKQLAVYGEAVPFDAAEIGNARYVIDDDGDLKDCKEMIKANGAIFVLEQDRDGDLDLTILDPTAAYINN